MENQEAVELIEGYYKENHSKLIRLYCYNYSIYTGSNPPFQKVDILYTKNNGIYQQWAGLLCTLSERVDYSRVSQAF